MFECPIESFPVLKEDWYCLGMFLGGAACNYPFGADRMRADSLLSHFGSFMTAAFISRTPECSCGAQTCVKHSI